MEHKIDQFIQLLNHEIVYLKKVKVLLLELPDLFSKNKINSIDFQNFIERHEVELLRIAEEKRDVLLGLASVLGIPANQVTFKYLVNLGYPDFEPLGRQIIGLSNEIQILLVKASIYLKNYARINQEFNRLNGFLIQNDYSHHGKEIPGKQKFNLYEEA